MNETNSHKTIDILKSINDGKRRIANKINDTWVVDTEAKQAILDYFKIKPMAHTASAPNHYFDKVPLKFSGMSEAEIEELNIRIVPGAMVRYGSFIAPKTVLMPCFINIGAYVGSNSMIDAQCTIGSCAQIGNHVHVGGGSGIGGVLEPLQANPTIIEDHCFIGARCEIAEGIVVGEGSVIGMGTKIGQSTKIYDRINDQFLNHIPPGSVVVPGSVPSSTGHCHLNAAIIVKQVTLETKQKTGINEILHQF
ncbi:MAG: 2,3,4,5-tetrahydropyridine-2,6-dicarboxylate N-succinyltransferase [Pseudomonadota bacterium]|nr:2,3,4,5-tetrahydropyridine-2,6-dicarboxylate N-succinyltransferase [Pseudomonadota bacterium]